MTNAEAIVATPRSGSFRGGVYEASVALADSGPYPQRAYFSNLRRVGSCPGNPLPGELKYYPGLLVGTLGPTRIDRLSLDGGSLNGDGMLVRFFADGGVLVVEGTGADWAGVVVLPAARSSGEVICLDALKAPPLKGEFHATKLSLAGRRPGTPIGGELLIEPCTE